MMSRKSNVLVKRSVYQMGVMTVVASVIWIGVVVYQAIETPIDIDVSAEMLKPLSPIISGETLEKLVIRRQMKSDDWSVLNRIIIRQKQEASLLSEETVESAVALP